MSVISKDLAEKIATKLTEKSRAAVDRLYADYKSVVTEMYEDQTPQLIKDVYKKHPEWFYKRQQVYFTGHGFNYERVTTTQSVICNNGTDAHLDLNSKLADKITSAKRKWDKAKKEYELLKDETRQALLTLKTFNNIRKELPEAAPMLPPPISNALVVNFSTLKKQLAKQPDIKEETVKPS